MRGLGAILLTVSLASALGADEIHLVGGGKLSGDIVERTSARIVVETGPGRVTLPMSRVTKVVVSPSALSSFRERARGIEPGDAASWAALGRWAEERDLVTQAREAYQRVLDIDPGHAQANAALGRALVEGRWLSQEESYRAQGLVPFEGAWVTPEEREASRRDRSMADLAERAERESEARAREAEARARTAEAEAERAEAEAAIADEPSESGIPYWPYLYGGGGGRVHPRHPRRDHPDPEPPPPPARRGRPHPTSLN